MTLTEAHTKLLEISNYKKNWDTHGAEPFSMRVIQSVKDMFDIIQQSKIPCEITEVYAGVDGIYVYVRSENDRQEWDFYDDGEIWLQYIDDTHEPPYKYEQIEETWTVYDALQQHFPAGIIIDCSG